MARLNCIAAIIGVVLTCVFAQEMYSDQFDHINMENILADDKLRKEYFNCFMNTAPCPTADAKFFSEIGSEAIQTKCQKCTEKQKETLNTITDWYTKNEPENWNKLVAKSIEDMKKKNAGQ